MLDVGVVIIGRNEGERLKNCIRSLASLELKIVYVDSNSTDDSVAFVKGQGFDVVELDMSIPFSAARARNEGYQYLLERYKDIEYIQFVDGDCEVYKGWIPAAYKHLSTYSDVAAVCGRRRERYPDKTILNALCDIEWNTPVGLTRATGGDFLCRAKVLVDVNGFSPQVIAGEEPELCYRVRERGWKIERIDVDMTLHDADMSTLVQWWKRNERGGHAYAQVCFLHGSKPERYRVKDVAKIFFWAFFAPLSFLLLSVFFSPYSLILFLVYPLKIMQMFLRNSSAVPTRIKFFYSTSIIFEKFPQFKGVMTFFFKLLLGKKFNIIEYKK